MDIEDFKKQYEPVDETSKYNGGKCKESCNCIEIAEAKNGGDMVKNYPCLGFDGADLSKPFKP